MGVFTGQFWPLISLTPGGRNWVRFQRRRYREFSLPVRSGAYRAVPPQEACQAGLGLPIIALGMDLHLLVFDGVPKLSIRMLSWQRFLPG